jgi:error-prone DNA polymerase
LSFYSELHCLSHFSFLRGASSPRELVERACSLGYASIALTDECSLSGVVRAHAAAKLHGIHLIVGSEITVREGLKCVVLVRDVAGYAELSALITRARQTTKGQYDVDVGGVQGLVHCLVIWCPNRHAQHDELAAVLAKSLDSRFWIAAELHRTGGDQEHIARLHALSERMGRPIVACGDVHMHRRGRRALQDTLTAIRLKVTVYTAGSSLFQNGEHHLREIAALQTLYPEAWLRETQRIAQSCTFSLDDLRYNYPRQGRSPRHSLGRLIRLSREGLRARYRDGVPQSVRLLWRHELSLIAELSYADYFLTGHDLVRFARYRGILL